MTPKEKAEELLLDQYADIAIEEVEKVIEWWQEVLRELKKL